jgi:precorrin-3B C17-methyltransferase
MMKNIGPEIKCGYVKNIGREGQSYKLLTLGELQREQVDMFTTIIIGNDTTKIIGDKLVTPRGYQIDERRDA